MKKFTTFLVSALAMLIAIPTHARLWSPTELTPTELVSKKARRAPSDYVVITEQPAGELKTFHRSGSYLYVSNNELSLGAQSGNVDIVFGADDAIYIRGILMGVTYDSWVSGTYDAAAGKVTIPVPQNLAYIGFFDACLTLVPIINNESADFTPQNITYTVTKEGERLVLTLDDFTGYDRTLGASWTHSRDVQVYGEFNTVFTEGAAVARELVVAPEGAEFKEYAFSGTDYNEQPYYGIAYIATVGSDVYLKGYSTYLPEALIKGEKDGNMVTFNAQQWLGKLLGYDCYFMPTQYGGTNAVFTYDAAADTYTATGHVFSLVGGEYVDVWTTNPVMKGVVERVAVPANPRITDLVDSYLGYNIRFRVPNEDTEGNGLVSSKLSYQFFIDVENEVSALTFTPVTHTCLTENMSIIPYGFTEDNDFYQGQIFLNELYSASWNRIGIKSIYTGGGVTNETEIQWYDMAADGINNTTVNNDVRYFDLQGRAVTSDTKGLVMKQTRDASGHVKTVKVVRK